MTNETQERKWVSLWLSIGAKGDPIPPFRDLKEYYSQPYRKYHNWKHITDGLKEFEQVKLLAENPAAVAFAYYYHDVIYDTQVPDSQNVEKSAELAINVMQQAQIPTLIQNKVNGLILITKHTTPPISVDEKIMVDIDFAILGKPEDEFDEYENNIRQEYSWVEDNAFKNGRAAILERFLSRSQIFNTQYFKDKYEAQAKSNLKRSLALLRSGIT